MKLEIDLMENYPQTKRDVSARGSSKTEEDRAIARRYGKEFFDGSRDHGYGGFSYNERFWTPVIPTFQNHWDLDSNSAVLDIGCAKGFMIYDMQRLIPGITIAGLDISEYAIDNSHESVKEFCQVGNAIDLPFDDNSFDVSISITTMHNLEGDELTKALQEIERVSKKGSFITVDAYRDEAQKERMMAWNLTAKTVLHVDEWKEMFDDVGYTGDYHWFMP
jgi:SAM-dependent methyltransferase